jgi:hypothetical protein
MPATVSKGNKKYGGLQVTERSSVGVGAVGHGQQLQYSLRR